MKPDNPPGETNGLTYSQAGVDIDAGNALVEAIKPAVRSTMRPGADTEIGGFGGLFDLKAAGFADPVLVADLEAIFNDLTRPACAWEVGLDGTRPQWSRGAAERTHLEPQSTTARRAISWLIGHLPIHRFL